MKIVRNIIILLLLGFVFLSVLTCIHAYKFTHFNPNITPDLKTLEELTMTDKIGYLFTGVDLPKRRNDVMPNRGYSTMSIPSGIDGRGNLSYWVIPADSAKGTIIMYHGYRACKSSILCEAYVFNDAGYHVWMVDFSGHGDSDGTATTVGYGEAFEVEATFKAALKENKEQKPSILYGVSMGAASVLRAMAVTNIKPNALIVECPFGSMLQAVQNRVEAVGAPITPISQFVVFWGGIVSGLPGFKHQPQVYAESVHVPTLLNYGRQDKRVRWEETDAVYTALKGKKEIKIFEQSGHQSYCANEAEEWKKTVVSFLERYGK